MYDLAREQAPTYEHLRRFAETTLNGGYNALGLYLEHRFAYPSAPWVGGKGCLTPDMVTQLQDEFPTLEIIPLVNLLGHFEGFLSTEEGKQYAEEHFVSRGMQACPSNPAFVTLCEKLLDDVLSIFKSKIIHIGGDETWQLGRCPTCAARQNGMFEDVKSAIYAEHFGTLAQKVINAGRRPAVWGDMFKDHPSALQIIPKETLVFEWQYFKGPAASSAQFIDAGYEVVFAPCIHTYNSTWMHIAASEQNVRDHILAAHELNAYGVCLTTWEAGLFGNYETMLPSIVAAGKMMSEILPSEVDLGRADKAVKSIQYVSNPQLPDPAEHDGPSVAAGVADSLLLQGIANDADRLELIEKGGQLLIEQYKGVLSKNLGELPTVVGESVLGRLALLAGMDPLKRSLVRNGRIQGSTSEGNFDFESLSNPPGHPVRFVLTFKSKPTPGYGEVKDAPDFLKAYAEVSEAHAEWACLMGIELEAVGGMFAYGGIRSALKCRFMLYSNPFLFWLRHREELTGEVGTKALRVLDNAISVAPDAAYRGVAEFAQIAINFVRYTEEASKAYAERRPGDALTALAPIRGDLDDLTRIAKATHVRIGGSLADIERPQIAKEAVERVMRRIKAYGDGSLGYLPSFETISHPKFVPHDQANWWHVNQWANE